MTNGNDAMHPRISTNLDQSSEQLVPVVSSYGGLTKREYFAALAMQAFLSQGHAPQGKKTDWTELGWGIGQDVWNDLNRNRSSLMDGTALFAVKCADALIAALKAEDTDK